MKLLKAVLLGSVFVLLSSSCFADAPLQAQLKTVLQNYLKERHAVEHISAAAVTVSPVRGKMISAYAGTTEYGNKGNPISSNSLFQIGSISKSFTSVVILHLAAKGKLSLDDTVTKYFPEYKEWSKVTIRQLLNMTSGIPNYSETEGWSKIEGQNIRHDFTPKQLVALAYGKPMQSGYNYTNTGYILAGMIAEKVEHKPFALQVRSLVSSLGLQDTFYYPSDYPKVITDRMPSGYYYSTDDPGLNRLILSKADPQCLQGKHSTDLKCNNMSWAGAAGAIVASTEAVTKWARDLFTVNTVLQQKQLDELKSVVSYKNGKSITKTTAQDSRAFGLGVVQAFRSPLGNYWYYQGETLGYRVLYMYMPNDINSSDGKGLIITIALNSQPVSCQDHIGDLVMKVFQSVKESNIMFAP